MNGQSEVHRGRSGMNSGRTLAVRASPGRNHRASTGKENSAVLANYEQSVPGRGAENLRMMRASTATSGSVFTGRIKREGGAALTFASDELASPTCKRKSVLPPEFIQRHAEHERERRSSLELAQAARRNLLVCELLKVYSTLRTVYRAERRSKVRLDDAAEKLSSVLRPGLKKGEIVKQLKFIADSEKELLVLSVRADTEWIEWKPDQSNFKELFDMIDTSKFQ